DDNNSLDEAEEFEIVPATTKKSRKRRKAQSPTTTSSSCPVKKTKKGKSTCTTVTKKTTPIHLSVHSLAYSPAHSYISDTQQEDLQQSTPTHDNPNIPFSSQTIPQQNPPSEDASHHDES
ncbi:7195_t:CDS:1, partial [Dentiscutata heterogama]